MDASIGLDELMPVYGSRRSESFLRVVGSDLAPALPWGIFVTAVGIRATLLERRERKPGYDWREAVVIVTCGEARTTCHRHDRTRDQRHDERTSVAVPAIGFSGGWRVVLAVVDYARCNTLHVSTAASSEQEWGTVWWRSVAGMRTVP